MFRAIPVGLLERSGVGSDGDEATVAEEASRFGDMVIVKGVFSELLHRSRKEDSTEHSCSSKDV